MVGGIMPKLEPEPGLEPEPESESEPEQETETVYTTLAKENSWDDEWGQGLDEVDDGGVGATGGVDAKPTEGGM